LIEGFTTERGDVLLSVQLILIREAEAFGPQDVRRTPAESQAQPVRLTGSPRSIAEPDRSAADPRPRAELRPAVPTAPAVAPPSEDFDRAASSSPPLRPVPTEPTPVEVAAVGTATWLGMTDTATGAAGVSALRRDLVLEQAWPAARGPRTTVAVLAVEASGTHRVERREAEGILRSMLGAAASSVGLKDKIYRTGPCELTILLRSPDGRLPEDIVRSIQGPEGDRAAGPARGFHVRPLILEPGDAVRRLSRVHWSGAEGQESGSAVPPGLAAAV
jgi:hypothetical protein